MGESNIFKLEISEDAYNIIHSRFLSEKSNGSKQHKGTLAVKLISLGMKECANLEKSDKFIKDPKAGTGLVQIKKDENASFFSKLDEFVESKHFFSRHFAARHCLYKALNI